MSGRISREVAHSNIGDTNKPVLDSVPNRHSEGKHFTWFFRTVLVSGALLLPFSKPTPTAADVPRGLEGSDRPASSLVIDSSHDVDSENDQQNPDELLTCNGLQTSIPDLDVQFYLESQGETLSIDFGDMTMSGTVNLLYQSSPGSEVPQSIQVSGTMKSSQCLPTLVVAPALQDKSIGIPTGSVQLTGTGNFSHPFYITGPQSAEYGAVSGVVVSLQFINCSGTVEIQNFAVSPLAQTNRKQLENDLQAYLEQSVPTPTASLSSSGARQKQQTPKDQLTPRASVTQEKGQLQPRKQKAVVKQPDPTPRPTQEPARKPPISEWVLSSKPDSGITIIKLQNGLVVENPSAELFSASLKNISVWPVGGGASPEISFVFGAEATSDLEKKETKKAKPEPANRELLLLFSLVGEDGQIKETQVVRPEKGANRVLFSTPVSGHESIQVTIKQGSQTQITSLSFEDFKIGVGVPAGSLVERMQLFGQTRADIENERLQQRWEQKSDELAKLQDHLEMEKLLKLSSGLAALGLIAAVWASLRYIRNKKVKKLVETAIASGPEKGLEQLRPILEEERLNCNYRIVRAVTFLECMVELQKLENRVAQNPTQVVQQLITQSTRWEELAGAYTNREGEMEFGIQIITLWQAIVSTLGRSLSIDPTVIEAPIVKQLAQFLKRLTQQRSRLVSNESAASINHVIESLMEYA